MSIFRQLMLFATCLLSGCSFQHYALEVAPGNTFWEPKPESVIILVGYISDRPLTSVSRSGDVESMSLSIWHSATNEPAVLALHQLAGEEFQLTAVTYPSAESSSVLEQKWRNVLFKDLPKLKTPRSGIYYYGSILIKNHVATFNRGGIELDEILQIARHKYPRVFEKLKPIDI